MRGLAESWVTKKDSWCADKIKNIYILCEWETERDLIENEKKKEHVKVSYYQQSLKYSIKHTVTCIIIIYNLASRIMPRRFFYIEKNNTFGWFLSSIAAS